MASEQLFLEGPLSRQIIKFSIPLMLSNVLQVLFNMSDIAVVGRFAGAAALGSVGSTSTLIYLFTGFLIGMGAGVNVLVARYLGARQEWDVRETVHTSALLCTWLGVFLMTVGLVSARAFLELLGTKDVLIDGAVLYLRIYFIGLPALAVFNYGNAVLSAAGDTKRPLYFLTLAGVINVLLNLYFVIKCRMGVAGVALASVLSQYLSAVLIVLSLLHQDETIGLRFTKLRLNREKAMLVLSIGIPSGLQHGIFSMANLFIQGAVNTFDAVIVEGAAAAANADALIYDVMAAIYTACASFLSQNYGAQKKERILKSYLVSLLWSFGFGAALSVLLIVFGREFLSLFTTEKAVMDAGMVRLTVMGCSYAVSAFMDCTIAASRGLGKTFMPTVIVISGSCIFRVIWVYTVFAHFRTIQSLYLLYIFSWSITAVFEILYFVRIYRKQTACM